MLKILVIGLLVSGAAFAADDEFASRKAEMLTKMSERIQQMEKMKACVSAAADRDAMKACHKDMKEWREGEREERSERREERREKRKEKK